MLMMYLGCYTLIAPSEKSKDGSRTRKNSLQEGNTVQETGAPRTGQADLSSTIQHFHEMATGEQQPHSPQQEAELFCPGDENQQSQWGCKWNVGRRRATLLLFVSGVLVGVIVTLVFERGFLYVLEGCNELI
ncbi:uncharacterized protein CLC2DL4 isoform X7 [Gallus gallus]|uniref:uncharacterized protein CLC2DL4 isoform X7 n=1 Tax=Gallus gallus TaxID=9031 RepID=UPI001F01922E|nr:uncharacterized protein CLC2DL4 isoform X7 [Gallus gallus]